MIQIIPLYRDNNEAFGIVKGALFVGTIRLTGDLKYEYDGIEYETPDAAKDAALQHDAEGRFQ